MDQPKTLWDRRGVLAGLSGTALAVGAGAASAKAVFDVPDGACDSHFHIYDPRFAYQPNAQLKPPFATVADYRQVQARTGLTRGIVVTPSTYGTDNRCMLDAIGQLGEASRGVAVFHKDLPEAELKAMHAAGVRGMRIQFGRGSIVEADEILPLAKRIAPLGWHMQFNMSAADYLAVEGMLMQIPGPIVIDHFGRVPMPDPLQTANYRLMRKLLDTGRCYVKLSAPYSDSKTGWPDFTDVVPLAKDFIAHYPERVLWAANYPFVDLPDTPKRDPLDMLNLLAVWAPDPATRHRILVENAEAIYGFDPKKRPKAGASAA